MTWTRENVRALTQDLLRHVTPPSRDFLGVRLLEEYPDGTDAGPLRWEVKLLRLSGKKELPEPRAVYHNTVLKDIEVLDCGVYHYEDLIQGTATIRTSNVGEQTVNLNGLLMQYPDTWKQLLKFDGIDYHS